MEGKKMKINLYLHWKNVVDLGLEKKENENWVNNWLQTLKDASCTEKFLQAFHFQKTQSEWVKFSCVWKKKYFSLMC